MKIWALASLELQDDFRILCISIILSRAFKTIFLLSSWSKLNMFDFRNFQIILFGWRDMDYVSISTRLARKPTKLNLDWKTLRVMWRKRGRGTRWGYIELSTEPESL